MVAPLPGMGFRSDLRLLLLAAHARNSRAATGEGVSKVDPLRVVATYVLMRSHGIRTPAELALLMGANERTARRLMSAVRELLSVTDLSESVDRNRTNLSPIGAKSGRERTDLSAHSLLSVDFEEEEADPGSAGGQECQVRPSKRAQASAAGNLKKIGVSKKHRAELLGWAYRKWPSIPQARRGEIITEGGYLYTMVRNEAIARGYVDRVAAVTQRVTTRRSRGPARAAGHREGPPCPYCEEPTETGEGRCGNVRCAHVTKVVCDPDPRAD